MARVFVSHASEDRELAGEVHGWLTGDGHEVFLDYHPDGGIAVGEAWEQRLYERLRWADAVVCLVTSAYLASPWCAVEVGVARSQGSRLLPLLAERGVEYPLLEWSQYANLASDPAAARAALTAALRRVDVAGGGGWPDDRSPFPGLRPFDVEEHRVFFGRAADVRALAELMRSPAERAGRGVLLVVGPSGCGKSSLVRAGLLPVMAAEPNWWALAPLVPGADPVGALTRELAAGARRVDLGWTVAQVRERLEDGRLGELADELLLAAPGSGRRRRLLVVVDQFEELFTQTAPTARARFAELLRPALDNPIQVVVTLRPEFLGQLLAGPELANLPTRVFTLRPLHRDALATVIRGPARLAGIRIEEQLVDRLVGDSDTGEALPLLAFTLEQLADGVGRGGQLSTARYEELGGVQGALVRQADAALADARAAAGRSPGEVTDGLLRLVTVDEQGNPTRWRVDRDELPEPVRIELDAFVARRLLTTDTDNGTVVVGVTHEAFLSAWPPLTAAIVAAASALRMRRAVEQAAIEWDRNGRPSSRLWERGQLAAAVNDTGARIQPASRSSGSPAGASSTQQQRWRWLLDRNPTLATDRVALSPRARAFLHASIRVDRRRRRRGTTILSLLLVLAVAAAGVAVNRQHAAQLQQRVATAHGLVARAEAARESDPRLALLLGIAAQRIHVDHETQSGLLNTLLTTQYAGTLQSGGTLGGHNDAAHSVAFAAGGRTLATSGFDGTIVLWDLADPTQPHRLGQSRTGHAEAATSVAFAPDGHTLATGGRDGTVILWDVSDLTQPRPIGQPLTSHRAKVHSLAFAPDGRTLATSSFDGTVILWDLADPTTSPRRIGEPLTGHRKGVHSVAFAPDGHTLATSGFDGIVILWDLADRSQPHRIGRPLTGHAGAAYSAAFASDESTLATSDQRGNVILWDLSDRSRPRRIGRPLIHRDGVHSLAFSPDGRTLATGGLDHTLMLWDLADRTRPRPIGQPLTGHVDVIETVAFAPDGGTLATSAADGTVILWDLAGRSRFRPVGQPLIHRDGVHSVAFSPDGRTLASGGLDHAVVLWDLAVPTQPRRIGLPLFHRDAVESVAFSPDGRTLASGGLDHAVILWDLSDRSRPHRLGQPLLGHRDAVESVAFAPDGRTLASSSRDGTVVLWDLAELTQPRRIGQPLTGHGDGVHSVAFSPDGRTLASGGLDHAVVLWDLSVLDTLRRNAAERACSLTGRGLDRDEWARYVPGLPYEPTCPS
jgi:WD40 repeat protein